MTSFRILAGLAACLAAVPAVWADGGDPYDSIRDSIELCATCHGETGVSEDAAYPIIAGQHQHYIYIQLRDFQAGRRAGPEMSTVVEGLEKDQLRLLGQYYSEQTWRDAPAEAPTAEQAKVARSVISAGQCVQCHLGGFEGASGVPRLAGQWPDYLAKTMFDYRTRARANAPDKTTLLKSFSEEELTALAAYLGAL